jgi:hypothetical protein
VNGKGLAEAPLEVEAIAEEDNEVIDKQNPE